MLHQSVLKLITDVFLHNTDVRVCNKPLLQTRYGNDPERMSVMSPRDLERSVGRSVGRKLFPGLYIYAYIYQYRRGQLLVATDMC